MGNAIYQHVVQYVTGLFEQYKSPNLVYHDLNHTRKVVKRVLEIAGHYQLTDKEVLTAFVAAWFHDVGYLFGEFPEHEQRSAEMMREFISKETDDVALINNIAQCILVTRPSAQPATLLQEILCDADTYHFGTKEFRKTNKLIKKELLLSHSGSALTDWQSKTLEILENHRFYTGYCKSLLDDGKRTNIERLKTAIRKHIGHGHAEYDGDEDDDTSLNQKDSLLPRGIQTMFRLASANHLRLSEMADRKAHILISVNSIIISVILTIFIKRAEAEGPGLFPALVFLVTALVTIILAILSTRPKVTQGNFVKQEILDKKTNLLFFGNFYKSTVEEYEWAMSILMKDHKYLYSVMVKDLHQLAVVLAQKYKLIRLAYDTFMIGLIITVITFLIVTFMNHRPVDVSAITNGYGSPL